MIQRMNFILTWKKQETKNIQIRDDRRPDSIDSKSEAELSTAIVEYPLDAEPRHISSIFSIFNQTLCLPMFSNAEWQERGLQLENFRIEFQSFQEENEFGGNYLLIKHYVL